MAVLYGLIELLPEHLANGDSVRLGAFGSFRVNVSSHSALTPEEINASMVKGIKISFTAGTDLKRALAGTRCKMV
jgi:predicted histone-like DNA-binding protein